MLNVLVCTISNSQEFLLKKNVSSCCKSYSHFSAKVLAYMPYLMIKVFFWEWSGVAKVSCILRPQSFQLILAYSWARPAILVAGKGRGGMFLFLLFLHFRSCSSFFPVPLFHFYYLVFFFSPFLWETTQN